MKSNISTWCQVLSNTRLLPERQRDLPLQSSTLSQLLITPQESNSTNNKKQTSRKLQFTSWIHQVMFHTESFADISLPTAPTKVAGELPLQKYNIRFHSMSILDIAQKWFYDQSLYTPISSLLCVIVLSVSQLVCLSVCHRNVRLISLPATHLTVFTFFILMNLHTF